MGKEVGIGERLKSERERLRLNQDAFAAVAGVTRKTLFGYESDARSPDANALAAWAQIGLDVAYVVVGIRGQEPTLGTDEKELVRLYREAPLAVRTAAVAALASGQAVSSAKYAVDFGQATIGQVIRNDGGHLSQGDIFIGGKKANKK